VNDPDAHEILGPPVHFAVLERSAPSRRGTTAARRATTRFLPQGRSQGNANRPLAEAAPAQELAAGAFNIGASLW
jgi:hypothetical protein